MPILGTVGIADKGNYSADVTYKKGNFVYHKGSSWLALKDNLRGVTPEEGENWKYLARGFQAELLSAVLATDTSGLVGTAGEQVGAQALMDKVSDMIATKVMMKSDLVSQIVNDATKAASMAALYSVNEELKRTNSNLLKIKITTYQIGCGIAQSGTMPFRSDGVDLTAKADYPAKTKLIIPLAAYNGQKYAIPALTSNRYLNLNGDNLTYTCVVAYLYVD